MKFSLVRIVIRKDCEPFQTFGSKHLLVMHTAKTSDPWVQEAQDMSMFVLCVCNVSSFIRAKADGVPALWGGTQRHCLQR